MQLTSKLSLALLVLVSHALTTPGLAADSNKKYHVSSIDAVQSCAGLNQALAKAKKKDDWGDLYGFSLYTMGYMTGINRLAPNTYDIAGKKNTKTLMVWLGKYCGENPNDSFDAALYRLSLELYPHRTPIRMP